MIVSTSGLLVGGLVRDRAKRGPYNRYAKIPLVGEEKSSDICKFFRLKLPVVCRLAREPKRQFSRPLANRRRNQIENGFLRRSDSHLLLWLRL